jgi:N-acetylmuramic acid 6-phosphate etherase
LLGLLYVVKIKGYVMKNILTEGQNPKTKEIDLASTAEILRLINEEDLHVAEAVRQALPEIEKAVDAIARALLNGGRLGYFGAGTSGRLGVLDASECWPTYSVPETMIKGYIAGGDYALRHSIEGAEDSEEEALAQLNDFQPTEKDVVVGISASGNPKYVLKVLQEARNRGAVTVGVTSNPQAGLRNFADICICTPVGPEVITGSSRMKSGTAQKMVLNMLSTASMVKIGKTYGNYMVDLQTTCDKLVLRSERIIAAVCGISIEKAAEYRIKADNNVKTACVMCVKQCDKAEAERLLRLHGGVLRKVIQ